MSVSDAAYNGMVEQPTDQFKEIDTPEARNAELLTALEKSTTMLEVWRAAYKVTDSRATEKTDEIIANNRTIGGHR